MEHADAQTSMREGSATKHPRVLLAWTNRGAAVAMLAILAVQSALAQQEGSTRSGEGLFDSLCSSCHQYGSQGMGEAPPLENSPWVVGPPERLVLIVLHGVTGKIEVKGVVYDREMPGFAGSLSDVDVAALATYIRERFGAHRASVSAAEVARIRGQHAGRSRYWDANELLRRY